MILSSYSPSFSDCCSSKLSHSEPLFSLNDSAMGFILLAFHRHHKLPADAVGVGLIMREDFFRRTDHYLFVEFCQFPTDHDAALGAEVCTKRFQCFEDAVWRLIKHDCSF